MDWGFLGGPNGSEIIHPLPPPPPQVLGETNLQNRISPSILLIVVILAVIFFISGLLHLLARCLLRSTERDPEDTGTATALQGQLQQLFLLHDGGVDQAFIDTLPVFVYKAIIGLKDPFDCAVCLCEFEPLDKLRLLPKCSHAFHLECIDTWLLSHSTCPLCRRSLLADFSPNCSPAVPLLELGSESSREACLDIGEPIGENDCRLDAQKIGGDASPSPGEKVVSIKLGKIKNVDAGACGGEGSSSCDPKLNERRCFSMGSFEYVMDEASLLQVPIKPMKKKPGIAKPGHRLAMSECDCSSRRHGIQEIDQCSGSSARIDLHKRESFSISKIWLRTKKEKATTEGSSRRTASFRLPLNQDTSDESMVKICGSNRTMASEFDVSGWLKTGSELGSDLEMGSCNNSIGSRAEEAAPSFARRTLLWIAGRQSRVVNHG